jgi:hypothetical protein
VRWNWPVRDDRQRPDRHFVLTEIVDDCDDQSAGILTSLSIGRTIQRTML